MLTLWFVPYTELSFDFMILTVFFNYFKDCTLQSQFIVIALKNRQTTFVSFYVPQQEKVTQVWNDIRNNFKSRQYQVVYNRCWLGHSRHCWYASRVKFLRLLNITCWICFYSETYISGLFCNVSPECILDLLLCQVKVLCNLKFYGLWCWPCVCHVNSLDANMALKNKQTT